MHFSSSFAALLGTTLAVCVGAYPATPPATSEVADWKYAHAWDGTVVSFGVTSNASEIEKRTPGGVFICDELNWSGRCGFGVQALDSCIQLGDDWIYQISSFGPDEGATCYGTCLLVCLVGFRLTWFFQFFSQ
ncbi:hypothetical protein DFH09DRAFT_1172586 [Mycena vulgaris]|nr:hypothetical protein DFH09DRAFT_1172586 [Mycena vulgaris]